MFIEHMPDKHAFRDDNETVARLEDIKTFLSKAIVKQVILIQEIIHIQKIVPAHVADVPGRHPLRWIFHIFFA